MRFDFGATFTQLLMSSHHFTMTSLHLWCNGWFNSNGQTIRLLTVFRRCCTALIAGTAEGLQLSRRKKENTNQASVPVMSIKLVFTMLVH